MLTPNITDLSMDFFVEFDIERGQKATRDDPPTSDYITITKVYFDMKECTCPHIKAHIEWNVNQNPEMLGEELW